MGNSCSHFIDFWAHMATEEDIQKAARSIEIWQKAQDANRGGGGGLQQHTGAVSYRLGGPDVVKRVVEGFYKRLYADEKLRVFLHDQDVITLKAKQAAFMSWLFGPPNQSFAGKNLRIAHLRLIKQRGFSPADFETGLSLFTDAMREQGSPEAIVNEVLMKMRPFKEIIFTPCARDAEEEARWIVEERAKEEAKQLQQQQIEATAAATATGTTEAISTRPKDAAAAVEIGRSGNSRPSSARLPQCPFTGGQLSRPSSGGGGGMNATGKYMGEKSGVGMEDLQAKPPSTPPAPSPHGTAAPASRSESAALCKTGARPGSAAVATTTAAGMNAADVTAAAAVTATAEGPVENAPAAAAAVAAAAAESSPPPLPPASPPLANSRPASRSVSVPGVAAATAATAAAVDMPDVLPSASRRSAPGSRPQSAVPAIPPSPPSPSPSPAVIPPLPASPSAATDTALPPTAAGEGYRPGSAKTVPELVPASSTAATTAAAAAAAAAVAATAPAPASTPAAPPRVDDASVAAEDIVDAFMTEVFAEESGAVVDEALAEMGALDQSNPADGSVSGGGNARDASLPSAAAVAGNGTAAAVAATAASRAATPLAGSQRPEAARVVAATPLLTPPAAARIGTPLVERQRPGSVAAAAAPSPPPPMEMTRGSTPLVGNPRPSAATAVAAAAAPPPPPSAPSGTPPPLLQLPSGTAAPPPPPPQPPAPVRGGTPLVEVQRAELGSGMAPLLAPAAAPASVPAAIPPVSTAAADAPAAASTPRVGGIALLGRRPEGAPKGPAAAVAAVAPPPKPPPPARISGPGGPHPHPGVRHKPHKVGKVF